MSYDWQIFIDGAARGNPGKAGAGVYIKDDKNNELECGIYLGKKTNNQAEYLSLLFALFLLKKEIRKLQRNVTKKIAPKVKLFSDSELLVKQLKGEYRVKNPILREMKSLADILLENIDYKISHVLREKNKIADKLANMGIDKKNEIPVSFVNLLSKHNVKV